MLNVFMTDGLFGDNEIDSFFSDDNMLRFFTEHEVSLAQALAECGIIDRSTAAKIRLAAKEFVPNVEALRASTLVDGMPVPGYVKQFRSFLGHELGQAFHKGSTSQDILDTAMVSAIGQVNTVFSGRLEDIRAALSSLDKQHGANPMMARTRMQAALPTTVGNRIGRWTSMINHAVANMSAVNRRVVVLQFGGPIGDRGSYGDRTVEVARRTAELLGIGFVEESWHTDRQRLVDYANWLSATGGVCGKVATDLLMMSQQGINEVRFKRGGSSSAMSHKENPILAETVLAQSRMISLLAGGIHIAQVHEQERSGTYWGLEWMILPQMCVATGAALNNLNCLLGSIDFLGSGEI